MSVVEGEMAVDEAARRSLADLFLADREAHVYALADLSEPLWSASRWWRRDLAAVGLIGLPGAHPVVYAVSTVDAVGCLALIAELARPEAGVLSPGTLVTGPLGVTEALVDAGRTVAWHRTYHRYHLADPSLVPSPEAVSLGSDSAGELDALYATEPGAAFFLPSMLTDQTFVGVRRCGALVAAAGTHVVSSEFSVAAIGAVFTHPSARGEGFGKAATAGVIRRLRDRTRPIETIGLNCADRNTPAKRIYLAAGFVPTLGYEECQLADLQTVRPSDLQTVRGSASR